VDPDFSFSVTAFVMITPAFHLQSETRETRHLSQYSQ
jgi:hypothetical protein